MCYYLSEMCKNSRLKYYILHSCQKTLIFARSCSTQTYIYNNEKAFFSTCNDINYTRSTLSNV